MMKISLHDLLLQYDVILPCDFNMKFGENMERFLAIAGEESTKNIKFSAIIGDQKEDGKLVLHAGEGQFIFAVTLICALIERLNYLEDDLSSAVKRTFGNMVKDETHYRFQMQGSQGKFYRDFVIDRITHSAGRQGRQGKFWVLLYRWFGFQLWKKDKSELENLLKMVRNIECKVHMIHLN